MFLPTRFANGLAQQYMCYLRSSHADQVRVTSFSVVTRFIFDFWLKKIPLESELVTSLATTLPQSSNPQPPPIHAPLGHATFWRRCQKPRIREKLHMNVDRSLLKFQYLMQEGKFLIPCNQQASLYRQVYKVNLEDATKCCSQVWQTDLLGEKRSPPKHPVCTTGMSVSVKSYKKYQSFFPVHWDR